MSEPAVPALRGKLKVYLGYAAGVGKTYKMLNELHELNREGADAVVGYFEPHGRRDTIDLISGLEVIPRRKIQYRGATFEEMDTEQILQRHPQVCAVDEFAHTNVPGSERAKRWEDVQVLRNAGIDILTTMNVQHLESLNDQIYQSTGIRVRETIPDWVVQQADEVVMVDLPPEALLNRLRRGAVYPPDKVQQAIENFFKESTLAALRELALRQTAHEVDQRQAAQDQGEETPPELKHNAGVRSVPSSQPADCILIYITDDPSTAMVIRRGKRVADYLHADCFAVCVSPVADFAGVPTAKREAIERHLNFARNLHIETRLLQGDNVARALVDFARLHKITQMFLARPQKKSPLPFFGKDVVEQVVRLAHDMQVIVIAERRRSD